MKSQKNRSPIICRCNNINQATIEAAIRDGAKTMNEIFDLTTAGVGPCGGSCRRKLQPMLETYLATGEFPKNPDKIPLTPCEPVKSNPTKKSSSDNQ